MVRFTSTLLNTSHPLFVGQLIKTYINRKSQILVYLEPVLAKISDFNERLHVLLKAELRPFSPKKGKITFSVLLFQGRRRLALVSRSDGSAEGDER